MTSLAEVIKKNVYQRYSSSPEPDHAHLHTWPLINTCNSFTQLQNYCTDRFSPQNINISSQDSLTILSSDIGLTQISACSTLHNIMQKTCQGLFRKCHQTMVITQFEQESSSNSLLAALSAAHRRVASQPHRWWVKCGLYIKLRTSLWHNDPIIFSAQYNSVCGQTVSVHLYNKYLLIS